MVRGSNKSADRGSEGRARSLLVAPRIIYELDLLFILLFDRIARSIVRAFELERALASSMIRTHPLVYGARAIGYTVISIFVGMSIVSLAALLGSNILVLASILMIGILIPIVVFTSFIAYPVIMRSRRRSLTESELPFLASYASIMARGGVSLARAMEAFSRSHLFQGLRIEAQEFFRRIGLFGRDPITALEEIASHHPSQVFRDFILGYVITLRTGGDVVHYLETKVEDFFRRQGEMIRQMVQRLGVYIEIYMLVAIVGGISLFVLFTSAGGIQIGGSRYSGMDPMILVFYNFLGLPLFSAAIMYAAHTTQPRWGIGFQDILYAALLSALFAPILYLTVVIMTGGYQVYSGIFTRQGVLGQVTGISAALLTLSIPTWLAYRRATKGLRALERHAASYIEDVSELRKTGLSPEKSLIEASKRDHGSLNPVVRRLAVALSIGMDIEDAVRMSLHNTRSWLLRVIFRFTIDSIKVGGGSPEVFYLLARYSASISETYERLRSSLRMYVVMPYIGAILFLVTSVVYLSLVIARPIPGLGGEVDIASIHRLNMIASTAAIVNAWIMGLVAGKISGLSIGEGFKHASLITIVSTIALWIFSLSTMPP
jgi:flagellar protein FlaJ